MNTMNQRVNHRLVKAAVVAGQSDHSRRAQNLVRRLVAHNEVLPCLGRFHWSKIQLVEIENSVVVGTEEVKKQFVPGD